LVYAISSTSYSSPFILSEQQFHLTYGRTAPKKAKRWTQADTQAFNEARDLFGDDAGVLVVDIIVILETN
jgi:hypothetical protein